MESLYKIVFVLLIFLGLLYSNTVSAEEINLNDEAVFNITLENNILDSNDIINVIIEHNLDKNSLQNFSVKPISENGSAFIYDDSKQVWVVSSSLLNKMPTISNSHKIKIIGLIIDGTKIKFQIQNKITYKIYESGTQKIWSRSKLNEYNTRLNSNISKLINEEPSENNEKGQKEKVSGATNINTKPSSNSQNVGSKGLPKKYLPLYLGIFSLSAAVSFKVKSTNDKIK